MRCPKCKHEPTMQETLADKERCPSCGIYYAKYIAQLKSRIEAQQSSASSNTSQPVMTVTPTPTPAKSRSATGLSTDVQPVVVVDVQMRFWSMVVFMVKYSVCSYTGANYYCANNHRALNVFHRIYIWFR